MKKIKEAVHWSKPGVPGNFCGGDRGLITGWVKSVTCQACRKSACSMCEYPKGMCGECCSERMAKRGGRK